MLFIKRKRQEPPSADEIAAIDNVVEVEATVIDTETTAAPEPEKKPGGFTLRKKADKPVEVSETPKKARFSLFGSKSKDVVEELPAMPQAPASKPVAAEAVERGERAPKKDKPVKAPKQPKAAKPSKKQPGATGVHLSVDVGSGEPVFWHVGKDSLDSVESLSAGKALSFSPADHLIAADEPMGMSSARDLAVSETGEDVAVVNASKTHRLVVATQKDRVHGKPVRLAPGTLALAALLKEQPAPTAPRVVGFDLRGGEQHVLILFVWGPDGIGLDPCQVIVNPSDIGFTVSQFAASRRLNAEDVNALFFDNAELLSVADRVPLYPSEAVLFGLPATKALGVASVLSLVMATGACVFAFTQYQDLTDTQSAVAAAKQRATKAEKRAADLLEERVTSYARAQSLDVARGLRRAQTLWVPGTTVSLEAKLDGDTFELFMPLVRGGQVGTLPSVAKALTPAELSALVDLSAPKDCTRTGLTVNGTLNEVQLTVTCESGTAGFTRYRLD